MPGATRGGKKGRKIRRNFRWGGVAQSVSAYMQRRAMGVPLGGNGGRWRGGNVKALPS